MFIKIQDKKVYELTQECLNFVKSCYSLFFSVKRPNRV